MNKWTRVAVLFVAASSVYSYQVVGANPVKGAKDKSTSQTDVKVLDEQVDPFAESTSTTKPADESINAGRAPTMLINADGTFSLNITKDADLVETLRVIGFQAQKSMIPSKDVRGLLPALDLYNVTVKEALEAILKVNGYGFKEQGNFVYIYTQKELAEMEKAARVQNTEVFRVFYTPAANAANMIKPVLSPEGQVSLTTPAVSGVDSGAKDLGGNSHAGDDTLVITDYPENLDKVRFLLKEVDRRPQQILIEATILRASLSEDNALGIDFTVLGGVDFSTLSSAGITAGTAVTPGVINQAGASGIVDKGFAGGQTGFTGQVPTGGLKVGVAYNNIAVFLSALEQVTDTVVLANPKVLALNKQKGEVIVGRKDGYLTTTVTESSTVQTVDFLDTGTRMIFRPYIGDDGYIRMEIHPEDSSGGLTSANLPFKITTEVTSNVMVKDGHTVVIGGLFRESSDSARGQVPGLGNIPFAGALFRNQRDRTTREEIIILLTPHIVKDDAAYSRYSEEELKHADTMRVGVRKGMMPFGRERLAESCYETAVAEMAKNNPDRDKAIWHLNCALNLNPKFTEAIHLKRDLTGEELHAVDNSTFRSFLRKQVLAERMAAPKAAVESTESMDSGNTTDAAAPTSLPVADAQSSSPEPLQAIAAHSRNSGWGVSSVLAWMKQNLMFAGHRGFAEFAAAYVKNHPVSEIEPKTSVTELPIEEIQPGQSEGNK